MCLADYNVARGIAAGRFRSMFRSRQLPRPIRARILAAAAACALLLALGGCGVDDDGHTTAPALTEASSSSPADASGGDAADEPDRDPATDEAEIKQTITGVLSGDDPAEICGTLVTKRYVKKSYGDATGCKKAQNEKAAAESLEIGDISISPEAVASTTVKAKGGIYGGEQLKVDLVLQEGDWKLDSVRSNVPVGP